MILLVIFSLSFSFVSSELDAATQALLDEYSNTDFDALTPELSNNIDINNLNLNSVKTIEIESATKVSEKEAENTDLVVKEETKNTEKQEVILKLAISHVSIENARENLETETLGKSFENILDEAQSVWEDNLKLIKRYFMS